MNDDRILGEMKDVLHEALNDTANKYIDETLDEFQNKLIERKHQIIIDILSEIEMSVTHNPELLCNDIHIVFKGR